MSDIAYEKMQGAGGVGRSGIYFTPKMEEMKGKGLVKVMIVSRQSKVTSAKEKLSRIIQKIIPDKS